MKHIINQQPFKICIYTKDIKNKLKITYPFTTTNTVIKDVQNNIYPISSISTDSNNRCIITVSIPLSIYGLKKLSITLDGQPILVSPEPFINIVDTSIIKPLGYNETDIFLCFDCNPINANPTGINNLNIYTLPDISGNNNSYINGIGNEECIFPATTQVSYSSGGTKLAINRKISSLKGLQTYIQDDRFFLTDNSYLNIPFKTMQMLVVTMASLSTASFGLFSYLGNQKYADAGAFYRVKIESNNLTFYIYNKKIASLPLADANHYLDSIGQMAIISVTINPISPLSFEWNIYINGKKALTGIYTDTAFPTSTWIAPGYSMSIYNYSDAMGSAGFAIYKTVKDETWLRNQATSMGFTPLP